MEPNQPARPFLDSWLDRTRKQLAPSGRLSELALILSRTQGKTAEEWAQWLRAVLDGDVTPSLDELTSIDALLARPHRKDHPEEPPFRLL